MPACALAPTGENTCCTAGHPEQYEIPYEQDLKRAGTAVPPRREELLTESIRTRCLLRLSVMYASHGLKDVFDVHELDLQAVASALASQSRQKGPAFSHAGTVKKHTRAAPSRA